MSLLIAIACTCLNRFQTWIQVEYIAPTCLRVAVAFVVDMIDSAEDAHVQSEIEPSCTSPRHNKKILKISGPAFSQAKRKQSNGIF